MIRILRNLKYRKKSLQEEALDFTDLSRVQEYQTTILNHIDRSIDQELEPSIMHLVNFLDHKKLDENIRETASNVIKYGIDVGFLIYRFIIFNFL